MLGKIPSLRLRYPTPTSNPAGTIRRGYLIPDDLQLRAAWGEVLNILAKEQIWDDSGGGLSALDTASLMAEATLPVECYDQQVEQGSMETIVPWFELQAPGAYTEFQWVENYDVLELSMMLKSDVNAVADTIAFSLNGTTAGYITFRTWITSDGASGGGLNNPSNGAIAGLACGATGLFHAPVMVRFWRGAGTWQFIGHGSTWRTSSVAFNTQFGGIWNSSADITTLRVSPVTGNNFVANSQFMLRGILA